MTKNAHCRLTCLCLLVVFCCLGWQTGLAARENTQNSIVRVGVYDNPPKIFMNRHGQPDGIFIDIIRHIEKNEGLRIEYIPGEWSHLLSMLQRGKIDVLPDMAYSVERDANFSLSTLPVLGSWLEIFTTHNTEIKTLLDLDNKKIGVLKGSIQEDYLLNIAIREFNFHIELFSYKDYTSSVVALKDQEIDAILADRFFYFSELCDDEIFPVGIILRPTELHFAFPKNQNPDLVERFDRNISVLQNDPRSEYYQSLQKWFDKDVAEFIPRYIIWFIAIIGTALLIVLFFTLLLQSRVKAKTKMLRAINQELFLAKEVAQESEKLKSAFLANISHEIRTPMNSIMGFSELLKNPQLTGKQKSKYIATIKKSSERMLNLINDIMDISKIDSGQMEASYVDFNVNELVRNVFKDFEQQRKNIRPGVEMFLKIPERDVLIHTDKNKVYSILANLVRNAIKFTGEGSITIGFKKTQNFLEFYVQDTGTGIPKEKQSQVFDTFFQADISLSRGYEGAGLGLRITKAFVELLGGKIWLESEPDKGTTFYFTIPYKDDRKVKA